MANTKNATAIVRNESRIDEAYALEIATLAANAVDAIPLRTLALLDQITQKFDRFWNERLKIFSEAVALIRPLTEKFGPRSVGVRKLLH